MRMTCKTPDNILIKDICKNSEEYIGFSYADALYALYNMLILLDTLFLTWAICSHQLSL